MKTKRTITAIRRELAAHRAAAKAESVRLDKLGPEAWAGGQEARDVAFERTRSLCVELAAADPSVLVGAASGALDDGAS